MQYESGLMPAGAEIAMQRRDERSAYIDMRVEEFTTDWVTEAMQCIADQTLMLDSTDPVLAVFEHLGESDIHKMIELFCQAKGQNPAAQHRAIDIGYDRIKEAAERAAKVEANIRLERGDFEPCNDREEF